NPNEVHEIKSSDNHDLKLIIIQFSRHFCNDYFSILRNTDFKAVNIKSVLKNDYLNFINLSINLAVTYINSNKYFELECINLLTSILLLLYKYMDYQVLDEDKYTEQKKKFGRMNRISLFIDSNYQYPIRLADIATEENITVTHLSHFFTENFGVTFQEYLNSKRLELALRLSENHTLSLSAISQMSGFSDPKYLLKAFRNRFGYSFKEYKNSAKFKIDGESEVNTIALQKYYSNEEGLKLMEYFMNQFEIF
ncbi:MAG: AraC family transcriptional regulator, partial [Eubacterium sp.]|nr:AraC family transcriptional regulator [Eubacterium sp.]